MFICTEIFADTHTHAVFRCQEQVSAIYAQQVYLHWSEEKYAHKKTEKLKLKKNIAKKECAEKI